MLASLGIDIVEIDRIRRALRRWPQMEARLFTERERAYCNGRADPAPHYAARFAAKEATAKALGRWLRWLDVEVVKVAGGRPTLALSGDAALLARVAEGGGVLLSLSHSRDYAVACAALVLPGRAAGQDESIVPRGVWT